MNRIYSLRFDLAPGKPGTTLELIAPVDGSGESRRVCAVERGKRVVDLRPGDWLRYRDNQYLIHSVEPFRAHEVSAELAAVRTPDSDGFVAD